MLLERWSGPHPFSRNKIQGTFLEHSLLLFQSRQELANFFYMIIGRSQDFKNKVLNNYKSCRTVKELASACDISLSAFKRQFSAEFGEAPAEWIQKQLLWEIKYKLSITDLLLITVILFFPVITWKCFNSFHKLWIIVYTIMYIFNL